MKAKLKNIMSGEIVLVSSTTDSPDSSYGFECWVDKNGNSYGQCQFGAPVGWALIECDTDPAKFMINMNNPMAVLGAIGGKSKSDKKIKASRANGAKPCAPGKKRGRPKSKTPGDQ